MDGASHETLAAEGAEDELQPCILFSIAQRKLAAKMTGRQLCRPDRPYEEPACSPTRMQIASQTANIAPSPCAQGEGGRGVRVTV